jgi:hypothetical protein
MTRDGDEGRRDKRQATHDPNDTAGKASCNGSRSLGMTSCVTPASLPAMRALAAIAVISMGCAGCTTLTNAADGGAGDGGEPCPVRASAMCADIGAHLGSGYMAGLDGTPAGFPPPPAGATLCGTLQATGASEFYASTIASSDLFAYYGGALQAQGYTVAAAKDVGGCELEMDFSIESDGSFVTRSGSISWIATQTAFEVNDPE